MHNSILSFYFTFLHNSHMHLYLLFSPLLSFFCSYLHLYSHRNTHAPRTNKPRRGGWFVIRKQKFPKYRHPQIRLSVIKQRMEASYSALPSEDFKKDKRIQDEKNKKQNSPRFTLFLPNCVPATDVHLIFS